MLTVEKHRHRANITLHARGEKFLHGEAETDNWETVGQRRGRTRSRSRRRRSRASGRTARATRVKTGVAAAAENNGARAARREAGAGAPRRSRERVRMPRILRASRQAIKPMSAADAARQLDADGDGVVVFRDAETAAISVLYRRPNGELTLVETEA